MGFFDSSSSSSTTNYSESTTTNTSTKIGDVGLTGQNYVDVANINAKSNADIANALSSITKSSLNAFQLYSGGTNEVAQTALRTNSEANNKNSDFMKKAGLFIAGSFILYGIYKKVA